MKAARPYRRFWARFCSDVESTAEVEPTMVLNADQCRAKASDCLDAAKRALYLDQRRLYEEIAEQWMLLAEQMGQKTNGRNGAQAHDLSRTSETEHRGNGSATNGVK